VLEYVLVLGYALPVPELVPVLSLVPPVSVLGLQPASANAAQSIRIDFFMVFPWLTLLSQFTVSVSKQAKRRTLVNNGVKPCFSESEPPPHRTSATRTAAEAPECSAQCCSDSLCCSKSGPSWRD